MSSGAKRATTSEGAGSDSCHSGHSRHGRARLDHALPETGTDRGTVFLLVLHSGRPARRCHLVEWRIVTRAVALERCPLSGRSQEDKFFAIWPPHGGGGRYDQGFCLSGTAE